MRVTAALLLAALPALALDEEIDRDTRLPPGTHRLERPLRITADGDSVPLQTYQVSFWAVAGEQQTVRVNYASESGYDGSFLGFRVTAGSPYKRPDGSIINPREQVLITISVDPENLEERPGVR